MSSINEVEHLQIPLQDIKLSTNDFADENFIASGGFGKVYQGQSQQHGKIAVKRLDPKQGQGYREFIAEISFLSAYKHENIVSLLGFCDQDDERILVYKLERNGSLDKHLQSKDLTWIQRLRICLDAARGLKYLHEDVGAQHRIIHRDVKSSNILLDENWKAKISDFGLSKIGLANVQLSLIISAACGTFGYIDPEYLSEGKLTQKSDVYSFGVVLFEVLCGMPARVVKRGEKDQLLAKLAQNHCKEGTLDKIIDSSLRHQMISASLDMFSSIASRCLNEDRKTRPIMSVVVKELEKALDYQLASTGAMAEGNMAYSHMAIQQSSSMASSSHSPPANSSSRWKYDVFLSFRGEDTRRTFVDHLYSALEQRLIYTFKDLETHSWDETSIIEESRIAVIIFSKNYADSSWCLDELAYIMKCRDETGLIVIPIFYDVDPSEVRKQKQKYEEAFKKHKLQNNNKVDSWRKALIDASNLSGWKTKIGNESRLIKEVVDTILNRLSVVISSATEDLVGMVPRVQDVKLKLEIGSGGVLMLGIWGVVGGGKTTLASSVYNEISSKFDSCCFIDNIREESSRNGMEKMIEKILSLGVRRVGEGRSTIKSSLCRRKVLIVLDDVDHLDQLEALAGSHDWFGEGSRIIITTRDKHLLNAHNVNVIHTISLLNDDEAIKLFHNYAPRDYRVIEYYEKVLKAVVSYADGIPCTLSILGFFLCDKSMNVWKFALARPNDIPKHEIMRKLKISYDGLRPIEQELFLNIACFFRGEEKDEAISILDAGGFHPAIGVDVLIQKALITILDGKFGMHSVVQELGHYIVRWKHPNNPLKHSRIWKKKDVLDICSMGAEMENDMIEALTYDSLVGDLPLRLPQVVANMKKLWWISWSGHRATLLPTNFQPRNLCCLMLKWSLQTELWEGNKYLPNLKVLDLSYSTNLIKTPNIDGLPSLEKMILRDCIDLKEIHPSIGNHERLIFLDMNNCQSLEMFPPIIQMKKLKTLILTYCSRLRKFPEIRMNMDSLEVLRLSNSGIEVMPSSSMQYCTNLVYVDLRDCFHLKSIEGDFSLLTRLEELRLEGCVRLVSL